MTTMCRRFVGPWPFPSPLLFRVHLSFLSSRVCAATLFSPLASFKGWGLVVHSDSRLTNNASPFIVFPFRHSHIHTQPSTLARLFNTSSRHSPTLLDPIKNERLDSIPPNGAIDIIQRSTSKASRDKRSKALLTHTAIHRGPITHMMILRLRNDSLPY